MIANLTFFNQMKSKVLTFLFLKSLKEKSITLKKMKTLKTICFCWIICFSAISQAQTKQTKDTTSTTSSTVKSDNLLDMSTEVLTKTLGTELDGNATGESLSYLELLNKSELPENQKTEMRNWYYLQAEELTQKQMDSLRKVIEKKNLKAKNTDD